MTLHMSSRSIVINDDEASVPPPTVPADPTEVPPCLQCTHPQEEWDSPPSQWTFCDSCFTQLEEEARIYLETKGLGETTRFILDEQEMEQCFKCEKPCMMDQLFREQCNLELRNGTERVEPGKNNDEIIVISDDDV